MSGTILAQGERPLPGEAGFETDGVAVPNDSRPGIPMANWYVLAVLFLVNMFCYVDRMALSMLQEQVKAELHVTDQQLGILLGLAFVLFYSALGIPLARLADRASRPRMLAACLVAWSVMTAVCGLARSYAQLFVARMGVGVGEAGCVPPAHSLIGELFPREKRALAIGIFQCGATVGVSAGLLVAGWLGEHFGWRATFQIIGMAGLPLALILVLTVRDPRARQPGAERQESTRQALVALLGRRAFVHLLLAYSLGSICSMGIMQWLPSFLIRSFGLGLVEVGALSGLASLLSSVSGLLTGGLLVTWLMKRDPRWELWLPAITMAVATPMFVLMALSPTAGLAIVMKMLATYMAAIASGVALAAIQSFAEPHRRATAVALVFFMSSALGQGLGPFLIGTASDMLMPAVGRESLRYALLASCLMLIWAIVHYLLAARTSERDRVN
ncbi:Predicted arabinose efflux permease, MFS family [Novosphingobium sp. CF614]|uniref:spinster family MFS transporter n=1 Tax=Novosphingobium sp. CF614 TaxID=1884364 RepID=UPI0008E46F30|nr:MFS transporter [Novosphingobium sp. CF614]SFG29519.1 Predicted arabinose efflux permease, MFS family [Novosphingobium sp. CF614]